jgi:hypothetical protein
MCGNNLERNLLNAAKKNKERNVGFWKVNMIC